MRSVIILLSFVLSLSAAGQKKHQVWLTTGEEIQGDHLVYERPIMQSPYFSLDSRRIETSEVAFFRNNHGYFARLDSIVRGSERYALRIRNGLISVYEEIDISIYGGDVLDVEIPVGTSTSPVLASGEAMGFYRKADGPITPAKYRYFKEDLADHPASMEHLKAYKTYRALQWGTLGAGIATAVAGLFLNDNGRAEFSPVTALGIGVAGASYFFEYPKRDELWYAVEDYNVK